MTKYLNTQIPKMERNGEWRVAGSPLAHARGYVIVVRSIRIRSKSKVF